MYLPAVFGPGGDHPVQAPAQQDRRLHHCESECAKKGQQTECCLGGAAGWGQHGGGRWSRERACSMEHLGAIGMESRLQSSCSSSGRTAGWHRWRMPKPWRRSTALAAWRHNSSGGQPVAGTSSAGSSNCMQGSMRCCKLSARVLCADMVSTSLPPHFCGAAPDEADPARPRARHLPEAAGKFVVLFICLVLRVSTLRTGALCLRAACTVVAASSMAAAGSGREWIMECCMAALLEPLSSLGAVWQHRLGSKRTAQPTD